MHLPRVADERIPQLANLLLSVRRRFQQLLLPVEDRELREITSARFDASLVVCNDGAQAIDGFEACLEDDQRRHDRNSGARVSAPGFHADVARGIVRLRKEPMLDVILSCVEDLVRRQGRRMADDLQTVFGGCPIDREIRRAILDGADFQKIQLRRRELPYDPSRVVR